MKFLRLLATALIAFPLGAQDPPADPPAETGNEYHSVPRPVRLYGHIRLDGLWEIHVGGRNTGVELSIRQISDRYHATFSKPPKNNPFDIKIGDDFLWATVDGYGGSGTLFVLKEPGEEGGPVRREQAPVRFRINNTAERVRVQVDKEDMAEAMKRFELVRVGRIESLRLFTVGPDGLQATGSVLEDQPMVVEIKHSNPRPSPIDVTVTSGEHSITLTARPLGEDEEEGPRLGLMRTEAFFPTFGRQLGVEKPEDEQEEPPGREATEEDWKPFVGSWRTLYQDGVLGPVTGWMHIDPYGRPTLRYRQPGEDMRNLKLKSAWVDGETEATEAAGDQPAVPAFPKLILEFEGRGVVSEKVEKASPDEEHRLLLDAQKAAPIILKAKDFEAEVDLTYRDVPDFRKVTLELHGGLPNGSLLWNWEYLGDRATGRDREGLGRAGTLLRTEGEGESTVGRVTGREVWMRMGPTILASYATDDQTAVDREFMGHPVYRNRYADRPVWNTDDERTIFGPTGESTRRIFIVARNLPPATEKLPYPDLLIGEGSSVKEYRIRARGAEDDPNNSDELKNAWRQYREAQRRTGATRPAATIGEEAPDPTTAALAEGMVEEGLFVLAIIKHDSEPGPQPFKLAEADGEWNLMFGDLRGTLKLARQLAESEAATEDYEAEAGEWEALNPAFAPEKIRIVVELEAQADSIGEIQAVLGHNNEIISSEYVQEGENPRPFILKPDPNDPKAYLSPVIHLMRKGTAELVSLGEGEVVVEASSGDKLHVRVQTDSGYAIQPTRLAVDVMATPSELNQNWKEAVKTAADLAGKPVEDWEDVVRGTADSQTNFIFTEFAWNAAIDTVGLGLYGQLLDIANYAKRNGVTVPYHEWLPQREPSGGIRTLKISVGDHAATLLLRREFLTMMEEQIADWQSNLSPAKVRGLYESQKDLIAAKQSPLSFMRIPMRDLPVYREEPRSGPISEARVYLAENKLWWVAVENTHPALAEVIKFFAGDDAGREDDPYLYQLFDNEFLGYKTRVPAEAEYFELFQWSAFNHAYRQWGPQMRQSLAQAAAIPDGDVKGLLKLTGLGFEPVVKRVVPRMMKLEIDSELQQSQWEPDPLARAHVKSLGVIGSAVRAQEDYSSVDTTVMMAAAAVATAPLGGAGFWSSLVAAGVSAADVAYTVYTDVYGNSLRKEELEFEVGAGAVLGAGRAAELEGKILGDLAQTFAVVGSGIGLGADGFAAYKAVKAMRTATLAEEGGKLLKQIDFADAAALRALSKQDKLVLKEMLERSEALAAVGRFGEIPEEFLAASKNRQSILKALDGSEEFTSEAIDLARKRKKILEAGENQPRRPVRDAELRDADEALEGKIRANQADIDELEAEAKALKDRHPDREVPPRGTEDAERYREVQREIQAKRNQNGDLSQRRDVVKSYRDQPTVEVPPRQAEILRGKAFSKDGLPPTRTEFDAMRGTRERLADGRPPVSSEGFEKVDLNQAAREVDELADETRRTIDELATDPNASPRALQDARARLDDLKEVRRDIDEFRRVAPEPKLNDNDLALLRGDRTELSELDKAEVVEKIFDAEGDWGQLKKLADGTPEDQKLLHKINQWRRDQMDGALRESINEAEDMLGLERGSIQPSAFGSTNLTSDYDISINAPKLSGPGRGPELAVRRFQQKVRNLFGGRESGMVVDTNVYTDPIYTLFKGTELEGAFAGLSARQLDTSRQFLFQQMANAKYRTPGQWQALRGRILDGVPPETRKAFSDILDQAEGANKLGAERINKRLRDMGFDPENATDAQKLRVNNDLYADTLEGMDNYKEMIDGLKKARNGEIPPGQVPLPGMLDQPGLRESLGEAEKLIRSGDPAKVKLGQDLLKDLEHRAILNLRNKQGEALYYAAEAYQAEATINHVVKEMQAPPKKVITTDSIMSGNHTLKPPKKPLPADDYINSYFENGANLVKELNGKHVLDDLGRPLTVAKPEKLDAAATKASKYFVRQLDAASMAKLDMNGVKVPGFPDDFTFRDLVESTIELEKNRGNMAAFQRTLDKYGMTGEDYLKRVISAQEELDKRLVGQSELKGFVNNLRDAEKSVENAASRSFREEANRQRQTARAYGLQHLAGGPGSDEVRKEFDTKVSARLDELDQAVNSGRFLTADQEAERDRLRKVSDAQNALDRAITGARLSGVPPTEITALLREVDRGSIDWREAAEERIRSTGEQARSSSIRSASSADPLTPPGLADRLSLPEAPASPADFAESLRDSGREVIEAGGLPLASLATNVDAGRTVVVRTHPPMVESPVWVQLQEVSSDHVLADDPVTGKPISWPRETFEDMLDDETPVLLATDPGLP
ncbi:hypothetical protein [Haloferula sp. A504]|uniref:hypothetical protein n=1 Tax=Haloferula sp. A504 TaxID=3373601 RepID=UPI0031C2B4C2|nr:hypothetical protein [Verrucomicrobiaceae bacterium E54]